MGKVSKQDSSVTTPSRIAVAYASHNSESPWDLRSIKYKSVLFSVCSFILLMELAERLSYYGINQGLKNFMKDKLGWSAVSSNSLKSTWTSLCYLTPLLGAWIADEKWGRFQTILIFGLWYCVGDFLVAFASHESILEHHDMANAIFMFGLFAGVGLGTGAIKSNVVTFGADQFDPKNPMEVEQRTSFFSWFYWCINIGAAVSYGLLSYVSVNGLPKVIAEKDGYFATYLFCAIVMVIAILLFLVGKNRYVKLAPREGAFTVLFKVILANAKVTVGGKAISGGFVVFLLSFVLNVGGAFLIDTLPDLADALSISAAALCLIGITFWIVFGINPTFMDVSKVSHGGPIDDTTVDEIKQVIRVLPFASFMVMWQCVYDQIDANFQSVAQQCDLRLGSSENAQQVPGAALGVFGTISIVTIIPVLENWIYPAYTRHFKQPPSSYGKVATGLFIATVCMFWSGLFETLRRDAGPLIKAKCAGIDPSTYAANDCFILDIGAKEPMNKIHWAFAIPMYMMVGAAECLINVTAFDVFYSNVPEYLRSTCQAINLFMMSMGANVTSIFTLLFADYSPDNLNEGNLEYMFYGVGAASVVNMILYVVVMTHMQFGMNKKSSDSKIVDGIGNSTSNVKAMEDQDFAQKDNDRMSENSMTARESLTKMM